VQRPRVWFHVTPLPQTAAGKVDRRALVAMVTSPSARRLV
jgi:acyl-coenzyme A synthetase/AMP-(fatty) acid ligase